MTVMIQDLLMLRLMMTNYEKQYIPDRQDLMQTYTFSIEKRHAQFAGEMATVEDWARALSIHQQIIGM